MLVSRSLSHDWSNINEEFQHFLPIIIRRSAVSRLDPHSPNLALSSATNKSPRTRFLQTHLSSPSAASKGLDLVTSHLQAVVDRCLHPQPTTLTPSAFAARSILTGQPPLARRPCEVRRNKGSPRFRKRSRRQFSDGMPMLPLPYAAPSGLMFYPRRSPGRDSSEGSLVLVLLAVLSAGSWPAPITMLP